MQNNGYVRINGIPRKKQTLLCSFLRNMRNSCCYVVIIKAKHKYEAKYVEECTSEKQRNKKKILMSALHMTQQTF